ncbi:MAG TPA: copper resistance CopC family protein [Blastocatellia bacterium]|nr:copper resistance CopC family protein [Blastocatellia bacterium]
MSLRSVYRVLTFSSVAVICWMLFEQPGSAHAILLEATPAANSRVAGPEIAIRLRFNSRIDAQRSRLTLVLPDGSNRKLELLPQPSPDVLNSQVTGLADGNYRLQWQVLATDGHITRGEFSFEVRKN